VSRAVFGHPHNPRVGTPLSPMVKRRQLKQESIISIKLEGKENHLRMKLI